MATATAIPAAEKALFALDRPVIVDQNAIYTANAMDWSDSDVPSSGGRTASGFPTTNLNDHLTHLQSKPDASLTVWYLHIHLNTVGTFDTIALINHDMDGATIDIYESDSGAALGNAIVSGDTITAGQRYVAFNLQSAAQDYYRYSNVNYVTLKLSDAGGHVPAIGEVIIGRRRQLQFGPSLPYEPRLLRAETIRTIDGPSGVVNDIVLHKAKRILAMNSLVADATRVAGIRSVIEEDTDYGVLPFLWCDQPSTAPEKFAFMKFREETVPMSVTGYVRRSFAILAEEQGPDFQALED